MGLFTPPTKEEAEARRLVQLETLLVLEKIMSNLDLRLGQIIYNATYKADNGLFYMPDETMYKLLKEFLRDEVE